MGQSSSKKSFKLDDSIRQIEPIGSVKKKATDNWPDGGMPDSPMEKPAATDNRVAMATNQPTRASKVPTVFSYCFFPLSFKLGQPDSHYHAQHMFFFDSLRVVSLPLVLVERNFIKSDKPRFLFSFAGFLPLPINKVGNERESSLFFFWHNDASNGPSQVVL